MDATMVVRVGTAGWSIPRAAADRVPGEGTHLQRYAARFPCAEINSSFHRPHRASTYARWAASVPDGFRFSVKLPKTITHQQRLVDCEPLLATFAGEVVGLEDRRGPLLVQLPPSFAYSEQVAERFLDTLAAALPGRTVIEPRHPSWYAPQVDAMLAEREVARVVADPPVPAQAAEPGGWRGLAYVRLHGSPRVYWSSYDAEALAAHAKLARSTGAETWVVYDNTASGAALANALDLLDVL
jgi:uncharacterized protein YecE (DUF72 family)